MKRLTAIISFWLVFLWQCAWSQERATLKLEALNAGFTQLHVAYGGSNDRFPFGRYLVNGQRFPAINATMFSRRSVVRNDFLVYTDAQWRWHKNRSGQFWRNASFHTGLSYLSAVAEGWDATSVSLTNTANGTEELVNTYGNDMRFQAFGLQLAWRQHWQPFKKAERLSLHVGLAFANLWTIRNRIEQYQSLVRTSGQIGMNSPVVQQTSDQGPDLKGRNFVWQGLYVPMGISYRIAKHWAVATELNLGLYHHAGRLSSAGYQELLGFSARIGYYF
jgi:hypothetical protein